MAETQIKTEPTSPESGVPVKVPVLASKLSQLGSAEPSAKLALRVRLSPASTSLKVSVGRVKLKAVSWLATAASRATAEGAWRNNFV